MEIREEFIEQAKKLSRGAEILPGGIEELAVKLQHAKDKHTFKGKTRHGSDKT